MHDQLGAERQSDRAHVAAQQKAEERYANSSLGLLATAAELRRAAEGMRDSNDRDAMLRVAAGYEQRAVDVERRLRAIAP